MKTKRGLLEAVNEEILHLQNLAEQIEASDEPDLRPLPELANLLEARRKALSLNPTEVSDLCGISPNTYRSIASGNGNPTIRTLEGIGSVLNFKLWIELK
ncbi:helix-turn-helix domain-containing protein [Marinobacter sp. GN3S48]|uniref:helix-turn-helix domain-containing protein n=1 Tax=Marinobacter sp. GN3S48 TaxID=3382302 RepID=UPI00387B7BB0